MQVNGIGGYIMKTNNERASIREVYTIAQRHEDKIDNLDNRISKIEAKASIIALVWSSVISILGIIGGLYLRK